MARVPLDYDDPGGETTFLALARIPASDPAHRIGSVFVNPGGPGDSGVDLALGGFGTFLAKALHGRFDIVGFDPRGVARSDPLHCFDSEAELGEFFEGLPIFPYRNAQYRPFFERYTTLAGECLDDDQAVAPHMSTADVARDMDLLRRAVGDAGLTYLGFSYGSYLGTTYANLFPNRIRALVIDGVLDPKLWSSGRQIVSDRVATQQEFDEFLRLCDAAGSDCAFSVPQGSKARWEALARSIFREPVNLGGGFVYTYDFLINDGASAMYAPETWSGFAEFFDFVADAALGDQEAGAAAVAARANLYEQTRPPQQREADYPNGFDAFYGNHCADTEYPRAFRDWVEIDRFARAGSRFGPWWWWFNLGCADWPVAADRYTGPWSTRTSAPVLVVGNFFDGITDYRGAQAVAGYLRDSRLLSYAGWGHIAYGRSACATAHINTYLLNGTLPARGTVCPANPNPFIVGGANAAGAGGPMVGLPPTFPWRD